MMKTESQRDAEGCLENRELARIHARRQSNAKGSSRRAQAPRQAYGKL